MSKADKALAVINKAYSKLDEFKLCVDEMFLFHPTSKVIKLVGMYYAENAIQKVSTYTPKTTLVTIQSASNKFSECALGVYGPCGKRIGWVQDELASHLYEVMRSQNVTVISCVLDKKWTKYEFRNRVAINHPTLNIVGIF